MPKTPQISAVLKKEHPGEVAISFNGNVVGVGKTAILALQKAKKNIPDIEKKEFLVSRIQYKYLAI